jgi:excisionase family DNA binding protein
LSPRQAGQIDQSREETTVSSQKVVYTIPEVMERLQISRWMVYELIHKRELESIVIGRRMRRVPVDALEDYLARRREEEAA